MVLISDPRKLDSHIDKIEKAVIETGILDRLTKAIEDYTESGISEFSKESGIPIKLDMIRGMAHRGSKPPQHYVTRDILSVCEGNTLALLLRKK